MSIPKRILYAFIAVVAITLLSVFVGIIIIMATPQTYVATALIYVQADKPFDKKSIQTQYEVIRSTLVLEPVVKKLNLHEILECEYGYYEHEKDYGRTVELLRSKLMLDPVRECDLIAITVAFDRPNHEPNQAALLAADTANEIVRSFMATQDHLETSIDVQIIQPAKIIGIAKPIRLNATDNIMWSILIGSVLGYVVAVFIIFRALFRISRQKDNDTFGKHSLGCLIVFLISPLIYLFCVVYPIMVGVLIMPALCSRCLHLFLS